MMEIKSMARKSFNKVPLISKISGKGYLLNTKQYKLFLKELEQNNITKEQYAEKYFLNLADKKHNRELKENEHYLIKNIKWHEGTYQKVIVNDNFKCELCEDFYAVNISSFCSHIKRKHKFTLYDYLIKSGYTDLTKKEFIKQCNFCGKEAEFEIEYNVKNKTFRRIYSRYFCNTEECKNNICLEYFNKPYSESRKEFDHIGGNLDYLCKIHNCKNKEELEQSGKSHKPHHRGSFSHTLKNYIEKYGKDEGEKRYKQRCNKISYAQTIEGYIKKYGDEEGSKKYLERQEKITNWHSNNKNRVSKGQYQLFSLIKKNKISNEIKLEYGTTGGTVDIYLKDKNCVIEFYGDYWHCNPEIYRDDYFNKILNMTAKEKHQFDKNRIEKISKILNKPKIIIIWQTSFNNLNENIIVEQINSFLDLNKPNDEKQILWI